MDINGKGNLAFPIRWHEIPNPKPAAGRNPNEPETILDPQVWAYHIPISREIFEANYRIIAATHFELFKKGALNAAESGPVVAALLLRDAARQESVGDINPAVALLAEINRGTTILAPGPSGYETIPVDIAIGRKVIDAEDWREAESSIVFFTCVSFISRQAERQSRLEFLVSSVLSGSITSSTPLEFARSLAQSTPATPSATPPAAELSSVAS